MKKTIITALLAISVAFSALSQNMAGIAQPQHSEYSVNAVGIPFGISKVKATELLRYKYGDYDGYSMDCITYYGFRLDGVEYESAHFFFNKDMKFTNALFNRKKVKTGEEVVDDALSVSRVLSEQYLVVNLKAGGVSQSYSASDMDILTMFRAAPRMIENGRPIYMINIIGCFTDNGHYVSVNYSER